MSDGLSVLVRMSAFQADVNRKKCFILFPQKRMKLRRIFHGTYNISVVVWRENVSILNALECSGLSYFIRKCNVAEYKRWAKDLSFGQP